MKGGWSQRQATTHQGGVFVGCVCVGGGGVGCAGGGQRPFPTISPFHPLSKQTPYMCMCAMYVFCVHAMQPTCESTHSANLLTVEEIFPQTHPPSLRFHGE